MPRWRAVLEDRWQARLREVTELSLAYHDAAEPARGEARSGNRAVAPRRRQLQRQAVIARRALADTEEALGRLSAGRYGRCELCTEVIPLRRLAQAPEARYCSRCVPRAR
jgi:RNA polymerase-binding transcription factor DksA